LLMCLLFVAVFDGAGGLALGDEKHPSIAVSSTKDAGQTKAAAPNGSSYRITLADGSTFELLGVCESPSNGKSWWRPDGSPLPAPPEGAELEDCSSTDAPNHSVDREFIVVSCIGKDASFPSIVNDDATFSSTATSRDSKRVAKYCRTFLPGSRANIALKYAPSAWQTAASSPAAGGVVIQGRQGSALFSHPTNAGGVAHVSIAYVADAAEFRIVAIDHECHEYLSLEGAASDSEEHLLTGLFQVSLWRIKEFRLQVRPCHRLEFRDISLSRGEKTNFGLFVNDKPYTPKPQ